MMAGYKHNSKSRGSHKKMGMNKGRMAPKSPRGKTEKHLGPGKGAKAQGRKMGPKSK